MFGACRNMPTKLKRYKAKKQNRITFLDTASLSQNPLYPNPVSQSQKAIQIWNSNEERKRKCKEEKKGSTVFGIQR